MPFSCLHSSNHTHTNTYILCFYSLFLIVLSKRDKSMAACGSIEHIFEKPLSETPTFLEVLSPWKHIKSTKPIDDSCTEMFGELHFKESHAHSPPSSSAGQERSRGHRPSPSERKKEYRRNKSASSDSLSLCTEGLGFESFDDVDPEMLSHDLRSHGEWREGNMPRNSQPENHRSEEARTGAGELPPPISSIGRCGTPWTRYRSYKEDGRFVLKEMKIPTQEFLHACRQDGRLTLQFLHSDDDEILQEEDDKENEEQEGGISNAE